MCSDQSDQKRAGAPRGFAAAARLRARALAGRERRAPPPACPTLQRTWFDRGPETNKAWLRLMLQRRAFRNFTKALLPYVNTAALTAGVAAGDSLACSLHAQVRSPAAHVCACLSKSHARMLLAAAAQRCTNACSPAAPPRPFPSQLTSGGWAAAAAAPLTPQIYEEGSAASLEARLAQGAHRVAAGCLPLRRRGLGRLPLCAAFTVSTPAHPKAPAPALRAEYPGASPQLLSFILTQEGGGEREPAGDGYSDSEEEEEGGSSPEGGGYDALSEPSRLEPHLRRSAAIFARLGMRPQVGSALHEFGRNGKAWMQLTGTGIWGSAFPGHASVDSMRAVLARMEAEGVRWGPALTEAVEALAVAAEADAARGEWRPVRLQVGGERGCLVPHAAECGSALDSWKPQAHPLPARRRRSCYPIPVPISLPCARPCPSPQLGGLHVFCRSGAPSQADLDRLEAAAPREQRKASALVVEHAFSQYLVDPEAPPGSDEARFNVLPRMTACPE